MWDSPRSRGRWRGHLLLRRTGRGEKLGLREQQRLAVRILGEHLRIPLAGRVDVAVREIEPGEVVRGAEECRVNLERLVEACSRGLGVALGEIDRALEAVGKRIRRLLLFEGRDGGERLVEFVPPEVRADEREVRNV